MRSDWYPAGERMTLRRLWRRSPAVALVARRRERRQVLREGPSHPMYEHHAHQRELDRIIRRNAFWPGLIAGSATGVVVAVVRMVTS